MDPLIRFKEYFQTLGVTAVDVDENTLTLPIEVGAGRLQGIVSLRRKQSIAVFYAASPVRVPPERRQAAAEYLVRANYGLMNGCFEMDLNDGEVRCRVSLDYEEIERLSDRQLSNLVQPAVHLCDRYLPGLLRVAHGGVDPAEAAAEADALP